MKSPIRPEIDETRRGIIYGVLAYGWWGIMPIYFRALDPASPMEVLAHRILWSAIFCLIYLGWKRDFGWLPAILKHSRKLVLITIAAHVLALNWGTYIYAVSIGNVLESSLGYFINPLMTVLVGVIVLKERLTQLQWTAIGLGGVAVLVISIDYGTLPWIALTLATTFTIYGYIKKTLQAKINAMQTMSIESIVLLPFAAGVLIWLRMDASETTFINEGWQHSVLLMLIGIVSLAPLGWFGAAATRLPLSTMGMLQFLAPVGQFVIGVFVFQEDVAAARWIGFAVVWLALAILTIDSLRSARHRRRARRTSAPATS